MAPASSTSSFDTSLKSTRNLRIMRTLPTELRMNIVKEYFKDNHDYIGRRAYTTLRTREMIPRLEALIDELLVPDTTISDRKLLEWLVVRLYDLILELKQRARDVGFQSELRKQWRKAIPGIGVLVMRGYKAVNRDRPDGMVEVLAPVCSYVEILLETTDQIKQSKALQGVPVSYQRGLLQNLDKLSTDIAERVPRTLRTMSEVLGESFEDLMRDVERTREKDWKPVKLLEE